MKTTFFTLTGILALAATALAIVPIPAEIQHDRGAIAEFNRIIALADAVTRSQRGLDKRKNCGIDPCCPDGSLACVEDFCSLGDGVNFIACVLGMSYSFLPR
ncbi:hypothetical protein OQA88_12454 [Cercophora sp. LCS_1]